MAVPLELHHAAFRVDVPHYQFGHSHHGQRALADELHMPALGRHSALQALIQLLLQRAELIGCRLPSIARCTHAGSRLRRYGSLTDAQVYRRSGGRIGARLCAIRWRAERVVIRFFGGQLTLIGRAHILAFVHAAHAAYQPAGQRLRPKRPQRHRGYQCRYSPRPHSATSILTHRPINVTS